MFVCKRGSVVLAATVLCIATAFSQQAPSEGSPIARSVRLNVVITTASGECVTDLQQHDFKIFDNNLPQTITSFRAVTISPKQVEVPDHAYAAGNGASTGCYEQGELFQYEITFNVPSDARPNEYHGVAVKVYKPNLTVRTRRGYFTQP
jgi:hypothetical protein